MLKKVYFNNLKVQTFDSKDGRSFRRVFLTDKCSHLIPDKIDNNVEFVDVCLYLNTEDYTYKFGVYPHK
jgi:hypothetical protein